VTHESPTRILVIDDEPQIRKLLKVSLAAHGYVVDEAPTGIGGIDRALELKPDLILLDLGLPDVDGKEVVSQIRTFSQAPIVILTVRNQEAEKIEALDGGADDYVTKPFSMGELLARIRVFLRRAASIDDGPVLACGDLVVDVALHTVAVEGKMVKLTPTEFEILKMLALHAGKVLTHRQLLKAIWGPEYMDDTHYLRIYIGQIRRKIERNPSQPRYIITESGVGYRLWCPR
jgi:two-component system KDP operon response regulator KdpE